MGAVVSCVSVTIFCLAALTCHSCGRFARPSAMFWWQSSTESVRSSRLLSMELFHCSISSFHAWHAVVVVAEGRLGQLIRVGSSHKGTIQTWHDRRRGPEKRMAGLACQLKRLKDIVTTLRHITKIPNMSRDSCNMRYPLCLRWYSNHMGEFQDTINGKSFLRVSVLCKSLSSLYYSNHCFKLTSISQHIDPTYRAIHEIPSPASIGGEPTRATRINIMRNVSRNAVECV